MPKAASPETQLRAAKVRIKELERDLNTTRIECGTYRARATRMEQEVSEWKQRFDILLRRDETKKGASRG